MTRPDARTLRDSPYIGDHVASQHRPGPQGFAGLLRWYLAGFAAETPERLHVLGVWAAQPTEADPQAGGSLLGAPKQAGPMRQLLENSPAQVYDHDSPDARYARPMRAALYRLASRDGDAVFMARFLAQVAYAQGDWHGVAQRWFPAYPFVHRPFTEQALRRLRVQYLDEPPARVLSWTDLSQAQRDAIEHGENGAA